MPQISLLDTRTSSFSELVSNGKTYHVPPFQRDYCWEEENWEDLWQDIVFLQQNPGARHYMGATVLQSSSQSPKEFQIIDGQQRLATLSIIAIATIERIRHLVKEEDENESKENNQERQDILKRTFLGDKDAQSLTWRSKLRLNENNHDFYLRNIINLRPPKNIRSLSKSNQLLWKSFKYFDEHLQRLQQIASSEEGLAGFVVDVIGSGLLFTQINVQDELNAYVIFETLNARGTQLGPTDLLKNYLFSLFQGPDDLGQAQSQWKAIIDTVQMEKFPDFLRCYLSLKESRVRRQRLFKLVRDSVRDGQQAFDLLDDLEDYSSFFNALGNSNDDFWAGDETTKETRDYVRELELFRAKQAYPVLLAGYTQFFDRDRKEFTRLLKLVCILSFRYSVVCNLNPNKLETVYSKVAREIMSGRITKTGQAFRQELCSIYVADEKFEQAFSSLSIGNHNKKLAKYILCKLEMRASDHNSINEDSFSIEHIQPQSKVFNDNDQEMVHRIGNLTPLELELNRQAGSKDYSYKKSRYQQSKYTLTRNIQAEEWTADSIANRQAQLARLAKDIWRSDFVS